MDTQTQRPRTRPADEVALEVYLQALAGSRSNLSQIEREIEYTKSELDKVLVAIKEREALGRQAWVAAWKEAALLGALVRTLKDARYYLIALVAMVVLGASVERMAESAQATAVVGALAAFVLFQSKRGWNVTEGIAGRILMSLLIGGAAWSVNRYLDFRLLTWLPGAIAGSLSLLFVIQTVEALFSRGFWRDRLEEARPKATRALFWAAILYGIYTGLPGWQVIAPAGLVFLGGSILAYLSHRSRLGRLPYLSDREEFAGRAFVRKHASMPRLVEEDVTTGGMFSRTFAPGAQEFSRGTLAEGDQVLNMYEMSFPGSQRAGSPMTPILKYSPQKGTQETDLTNEHPTFGELAPFLEKTLRARNKTWLHYLQTAAPEWKVRQHYLALDAQRKTLETDLGEAKERSEVWKGFFLPEDTIRRVIAALELFKNGDPAASPGFLLKGPSSTGKTELARRIAQAGGFKFIARKPADLKLDMIGGPEQAVKKLWEEARESAPCVVFIDECDNVLVDREAGDADQFAKNITGAFLAEWEGISSSAGILVIGATNKPNRIDNAIMERFGETIEVSPPDADGRRYILQGALEKVGIDLQVTPEIVNQTTGMSARKLVRIAQNAKRNALADGSGSVHERHILKAIAEARSGKGKAEGSAKQYTWDDVVLSDEERENLETIVFKIRNAEEMRRQNISLPRGIILYGPPGVGKTLTVKVLASQAGVHYDFYKISDLKATVLGVSAHNMRAAFEKARANSPSILVIDEIDSVGGDRDEHSQDVYAKELIDEFLVQTEGLQDDPRHVFVIGMTNRMEALDAAFKRRLPEHIFLGLPNQEAREKILLNLLKEKPVEFDVESFATRVAAQTEGKSGSDLRALLEKAENRATTRARKEDTVNNIRIREEDFLLNL